MKPLETAGMKMQRMHSLNLTCLVSLLILKMQVYVVFGLALLVSVVWQLPPTIPDLHPLASIMAMTKIALLIGFHES